MEDEVMDWKASAGNFSITKVFIGFSSSQKEFAFFEQQTLYRRLLVWGMQRLVGWSQYPCQPARIFGKGEIIHDLQDPNPVPEQKKTRGEKFSNRVVDAGQFPQPVPIQVFEV
jgi:hypothetical protein